ncbi:MAG TPA: DUF2789 domain-containing protein [Hyphomicrobiales bacterium]|nr:DUF2789 domain-containing protein [Hyphomicrobiales bacterium]
MHQTAYSINTLFVQLGMDGSDATIEEFVRAHHPLPATMALADAPCWTPAQAKLLSEAVCDDADWAPVVDQLDALLRESPQL